MPVYRGGCRWFNQYTQIASTDASYSTCDVIPAMKVEPKISEPCEPYRGTRYAQVVKALRPSKRSSGVTIWINTFWLASSAS